MTQLKKKENIKSLSGAELKKKLSDLRENLRQSHFKGEGGKSKDVKERGKLRKEIARVLTVINQNEK